jgi:hypothetical protein
MTPEGARQKRRPRERPPDGHVVAAVTSMPAMTVAQRKSDRGFAPPSLCRRLRPALWGKVSRRETDPTTTLLHALVECPSKRVRGVDVVKG